MDYTPSDTAYNVFYRKMLVGWFTDCKNNEI